MIQTRDTDWLAEHGLELCEKYPNKWVAVHDCEVIAASDTLGETAEAALKLRPQRDFILEQINLDVDLPHVD